LQEIRTFPEQLTRDLANPDGWFVEWHPARKPGYSGTAIWSRFPIRVMQRGLSKRDLDLEGRLIECEVSGMRVVSVYLPSGSSGAHRQKVKDQWMPAFSRWARRRLKGQPVVIGGDLNVAHTENDIFYAAANCETSGFLPHERYWMGQLIESGWHDLIREQFGDVPGPYSWWSNQGRARELDRGWRIDYLLCNPDARSLVRSASIDRASGLAVSDHAAVTIDLDC
jgi:exodeoxyribonuclease-3